MLSAVYTLVLQSYVTDRQSSQYRSNLTWEQWELISALFPEAKTGGRPRTVAMYAVAVLCHYLKPFLPTNW
jgi:hypothetical protein